MTKFLLFLKLKQSELGAWSEKQNSAQLLQCNILILKLI